MLPETCESVVCWRDLRFSVGEEPSVENPYLPPSVEETAARVMPAAGTQRRYTPGQIAIATFIGGLVAAGWLLGVNEEANGRQSQRWVYIGIAALLTLVVGVIQLRIDTPALGVGITIASVSTAHAFAKQFERRKAPTIEWLDHSGWSVAGIATLGFLFTVALALGLGALFGALGISESFSGATGD